MVRGYGSHRSNFHPVLNLAHLKQEHTHMFIEHIRRPPNPHHMSNALRPLGQ